MVFFLLEGVPRSKRTYLIAIRELLLVRSFFQSALHRILRKCQGVDESIFQPGNPLSALVVRLFHPKVLSKTGVLME